jgi:hypothetical protein
MVLASSKVQSGHSAGGTKGNHKEPQSGYVLGLDLNTVFPKKLFLSITGCFASIYYCDTKNILTKSFDAWNTFCLLIKKKNSRRFIIFLTKHRVFTKEWRSFKS